MKQERKTSALLDPYLEATLFRIFKKGQQEPNLWLIQCLPAAVPSSYSFNRTLRCSVRSYVTVNIHHLSISDRQATLIPTAGL